VPVQSGVKVKEVCEWLKIRFGRSGTKYWGASVYLWLGTCDLTAKGQEGLIELRQRDNSSVEYIIAKYREILQFLQSRQCEVTIIETPYYSIKHWNCSRGHQYSESFDEDDKILRGQIDLLNKRIAEINIENTVLSPKLNIHLNRSRTNKGKTQYYTNWGLFIDGIHPKPILAKTWLCKLTYYIVKGYETNK
jgi:hypothetical protein